VIHDAQTHVYKNWFLKLYVIYPLITIKLLESLFSHCANQRVFHICVSFTFQKKNADHVLGVTMQENGLCEEECLLRFVAEH